MKKIFALLIALMLLVSFAGCGQETENNEIPEETENGISEEDAALYEEILLNFGATYRHDGSLVVSRKGSFYDSREGIEDCSALDANTYYTWISSLTENSDKTIVSIPDVGEGIYAYSADFYESEICKYFGIDAETLRGCDYYYAEQNCYYFDGVSSSGEYVSIDLVSAEENEDLLTLHFTLSDFTNGTANYALTVKILPEGGYNYVSYLPEEI